MNFIKKISLVTSLITSVQALANGPRVSYFHPQHNWLPVVSICTVPEMYGKNDYDGHMRILENYSPEKKELVQCKNLDSKPWQKISIKRRGNSSDHFAKKQYRVKLLDKNGEKVELALGGLAESSKWVLNAPYVDRAHIRNIFTFQLGRAMGENRGDKYFAPQTKSYELFLNGKYHGVYVLIEKIERDKNKVNVPKIKKQSLDNISFLAEVSSNDGEYKSIRGTYLNYRYPSLKKMNEIAEDNPERAKGIKLAIQKSINDLEEMFADEYKLKDVMRDPDQKYFDVDSFIDFIIIQELTKNVDGFRRSAYFYRTPDGKFHMGPLWDFNLALGNLSFYGMSKPEGWLHRRWHGVMKNAFWFSALINNKTFRKKLIKRYFHLRQISRILDTDNLFKQIEQKAEEMRTGSLRDLHAWHDSFSFAERKFMITKEKGITPRDHVEIMKRWLKKRLRWMDKNIKKL